MAVVLLLFLCVPAFAQSRPATLSDVAGANLPAQRIGPNDLIAVSVYDAPELTRTIRVSSDGTIRLPMVKQRLKAEGLMPADLEEAIAKVLDDEEILVDPIVTVTIAEYNSRPISVAGEVRQPITFQAFGRVTLLEALTRAGGLGPEAGPEILVTTPSADGQERGAQVLRIPVHGLIDSADPKFNIELHGGEEVRVPQVGHIFVVGNVKKPGAFRVEDGLGMTILKALAMAEGLAPYSTKDAYIYRTADGSKSRREIRISLRNIMDRKADDVPLEPNDILYVPDARGRRVTVGALDRIIGFGAGTMSGILIYGSR